MNEPSEPDLAARGRAIFDRLRSEGAEDPPSEPDGGDGAPTATPTPDQPAPEPVPDSAEAAPGGDELPSAHPGDEIGSGASPEPDEDEAAPARPDASDGAPAPIPPAASGPAPGEAAELPPPEAEDRADMSVATAVSEPPPPSEPSPGAPPLVEPPAAEVPLPDGAASGVATAEPPTATIDETLPAADPRPDEPAPAMASPPTEPAAPPEPPPSPFRAPLPRVVAIANQKGGVGKTTTAVNLSACLAELGYRVLVVDLDPQGNATTGLGVNPRNLQVSMYDVLLNDRGIDDCIEPTAVRGLFVAPSSLDLAGAEIELVPVFSREMKLKRALAEVIDDYDFVLIDCPPSLGLLTVNGLAAAGEVLVPIQCEYYALEGLGQLLRNVNLVQQNLNPDLELRAIVLVMYDARTKLSGEVVAEVRTHFGEKVCRNVIPRTVRLSEAPSFGQPIISFDPSSRGAIAYRELAREFSGGAAQLAGAAG